MEIQIGNKFGNWTVKNISRNLKNRKLFCEVICKCGISKSVCSYNLQKGLSKECFNCSRKTSIENRRKNMLKVGDRINGWEIIETFKKDNKTYGKGKCICGSIHEKKISNFYHSKNCNKCRIEKYKGVKSIHCRKGYKDISGSYWSALKTGAKDRNYEFSITIEYAWELYLKQNKKCSLSDIPLKLGYLVDGEQTGSIDRIDNNKGYIEENVQWVHKDINKMKNAFSEEYFIELCKSVTENLSKCG